MEENFLNWIWHPLNRPQSCLRSKEVVLFFYFKGCLVRNWAKFIHSIVTEKKKAASKNGKWLFLILFCNLQHKWSDVNTVAMCHYTVLICIFLKYFLGTIKLSLLMWILSCSCNVQTYVNKLFAFPAWLKNCLWWVTDLISLSTLNPWRTRCVPTSLSTLVLKRLHSSALAQMPNSLALAELHRCR